jgi:tetratricopeptide (TPR) repeat protein
MVLVNLGVALYRQERLGQALQSFQVARQTCKHQNLRPAAAHVLDCQAQTYQADDKREEAERCWLEALAVFNGITADAFANLRESGRSDILNKLEQHYKSTNQKDKLTQLQKRQGVYA